jgi:hypothetical protein
MFTGFLMLQNLLGSCDVKEHRHIAWGVQLDGRQLRANLETAVRLFQGCPGLRAYKVKIKQAVAII